MSSGTERAFEFAMDDATTTELNLMEKEIEAELDLLVKEEERSGADKEKKEPEKKEESEGADIKEEDVREFL